MRPSNKLTAMSGIEPKKYIGEKNTYLSPPKRGRSLENKNEKYKESSVRLPPSADNTILSFKISHFLAIYLQISPKNLR